MRLLARSALGFILLTLGSCSSAPPPRLRTPAEIEEARRQVPTVYLTGKTFKKVMAPMVSEPWVDKETNEVCWSAYYCTNPDCPGKNKGTDGDPLLFAHVDPLTEAGPDGKPRRIELPDGVNVYEEMRKRGGYAEPTCPECLKIRSPGSINVIFDKANPRAKDYQERIKYRSWIKPYYPPETQKRLAELDADQAKWEAYVLERKNLPNKLTETEEKK